MYCWVDGAFQYVLHGQKLRKKSFAPRLSDSEMVALEIVAEFLGIDTDKGLRSADYKQALYEHTKINLQTAV